MAAAIVTSSTTLEAQFVEIATALQAAESDTAKNPDNANNVSVSANLDNGTVSISASMPVIPSIANGKLTLTADPYLS